MINRMREAGGEMREDMIWSVIDISSREGVRTGNGRGAC